MVAATVSEPCTCSDCRALDRQHPEEGVQLKLLPSLGAEAAAPPAPIWTAPAIVTLLRATRLSCSSEAKLQKSIDDALTARGVPFDREAILGPGERIDFLAGRVGVEAKARYAKRATFRQLERYALHDTVDALILVTGTAMGLPPTLNGKPLYIVSVGRTFL